MEGTPSTQSTSTGDPSIGERPGVPSDAVAQPRIAHFAKMQQRFVPEQLYHDLQATIRAKFHLVGEAQRLCPTEKLYLWMAGTDGLENLFATVRCLTHARNVDAKELGERFSSAIGVEQVFEKKPHLKRTSKRLNGSEKGLLDHTNTRYFDDHGPANNTDVRDVDLASCWFDGRRDAIAILQRHPSYMTRLDSNIVSTLEKQGVTMFMPFG